MIEKNLPTGVKYSKIYLVPQITNETIENYPFSYEFLGQVLYAGSNRKDHATLTNENVPKLFCIMFMFLNMNKRTKFNGKLLENNNLHQFLRLPFTNEDLKASDDLKKALDLCI